MYIGTSFKQNKEKNFSCCCFFLFCGFNIKEIEIRSFLKITDVYCVVLCCVVLFFLESGGIGKGSTFYFFLPCVPCLPDSQSSESSSIESLSSLNSSNGHSMKLQETWSQKSNDKTTTHSDTSLVTSPSEFPQFHLNILVVEVRNFIVSTTLFGENTNSITLVDVHQVV
jgi:hypothetical protein